MTKRDSSQLPEMQPLAGIKVVDLSRVLAGPWASQSLADLGAEVIKIERPIVGDDTRHWGPPYLKDTAGNPTTESAYFMSANRGKNSISVDITSEAGQATIHKLVADADVVIENYKVGGLKKYHLDYDSLSAINPRLVYCSITGFGQTGPYAKRPGYDFMIQAMSGLMSITGAPDDAGGEPTKVGVAIVDIITGLYAVMGIQAALIERQRTGQGKHVDIALLDCATAVLANQATNYLVGGKVPERLGNSHPNIVPYQSFATADGHIIIAVGNDSQFQALCACVEQPELADDDRYQTNTARVTNRAALIETLQSALAMKSSSDWLNMLEQHNVPAGPINTIDQVFSDPQVMARDMIQTVQHPYQNDLRLVASPIRFSGEQKRQSAAPPLLQS